MKNILKLSAFFLSIVFLTLTSENFSQNGLFSYIEPKSNAQFVKNNSTISFKVNGNIDITSLANSSTIEITGSISGKYEYEHFFVNKENLFIIKPKENFKNDEVITLQFLSGIKNNNGSSIKPFKHIFRIQKESLPHNSLIGFVNEIPADQLEKLGDNSTGETEAFPVITVNYSNNPAQGKILLSNIVFNVQIL